jgi:two-component system, sensor histidine kinase and response regulator
MSDACREAGYDTRLVSAVAEALSFLIAPGDFESALHEAARCIGEAAHVDRVYVFEARGETEDGPLVLSERYEWVRMGISLQLNNPLRQSLPIQHFPHLLERFRAGQSFCAVTRELSQAERAILEPQGVLSFALMPIVVRGAFWGFVGLDDCHEERVWSAPELECLRAAAAGLAGAIVRYQMEDTYRAQADELRRHRRAALSLAEDARRAESTAAQASAAKSIFLAMMSHEIRTPLNGVIGFTDLLLAEGLPERQAEIASGIKTCGETLLSLISDILDISKIESGKLELHPEAVDVVASARSVLAAFEPLTSKAGVALRLDVAEDLPPWLWLDVNRFCQLLFNLIGNAVKFTPQGRIDVCLSIGRSPEGEQMLWGKVADTGLGISEEELAEVFEPFLQGEGARRRASGGSGLGLAICRRLVEAMKGTIEATSRLGQGSEFVFAIATREATAPDTALRDQEAVSSSEERSGRILVVDDVFMNVRLVLSLLKRLGYTADTASGGLQVLQMCRETTYDLIFMDILMPEMDGRETVKKLREAQHFSGTPRAWIVALTADALLENRQSCAEAGMDDFLTKPLRLKDIEGAIARWKTGKATLNV